MSTDEALYAGQLTCQILILAWHIGRLDVISQCQRVSLWMMTGFSSQWQINPRSWSEFTTAIWGSQIIVPGLACLFGSLVSLEMSALQNWLGCVMCVPWSVSSIRIVGNDLFVFKSVSYLLVVEYSRYVEVVRLEELKAACTINYMKSIFARHGIPDLLVSDNGPQYACAKCFAFAKSYDFVHQTSSPKDHPRNGEAERAVQTVKDIKRKSSDVFRLAGLERYPASEWLLPSGFLDESEA